MKNKSRKKLIYNIEYEHEGATACDPSGPTISGPTVYFLKGQFADGCLLGFWSCSPWGRIHNQDRGWVVIKPRAYNKRKGEVIDSIQTYDFGSIYRWRDLETFATWRKRQKKEHGKLTRWVKDYYLSSGRPEDIWSMKET